MAIYLMVGLILAGVIYRKDLWKILLTVIAWPFTLIEAVRMSTKKNERKEEEP